MSEHWLGAIHLLGGFAPTEKSIGLVKGILRVILHLLKTSEASMRLLMKTAWSCLGSDLVMEGGLPLHARLEASQSQVSRERACMHGFVVIEFDSDSRFGVRLQQPALTSASICNLQCRERQELGDLLVILAGLGASEPHPARSVSLVLDSDPVDV